eukprot:TRINITY_DN5760_c0_g1_i1.p1 TRINITY_DN5760_c0_g1~~TRINITY_DN5760_c0_g1_i1.p1  ORF type:complete len:142 (+),score=10.24 TRINITY_DN5760_c0_g1_i1:136-561(+)
MAQDPVWDFFCKSEGYSQEILRRVKLLELTPDGFLRASLLITEAECNFSKVLHGAAYSFLTDMLTSVAIAKKDKETRAGVSIELSVSFIKALPLGSEVIIESTALRTGRNLAFANALFLLNGEVYARAHHTKFLNNVVSKL